MKFRLVLMIVLCGFAANLADGQNAKSRTEPLAVGATAPDFELSGQNGKTVKLSKIKKTTILVFYRGYW